ncbi:hypothetical protein PhaeoP23_02555 [Phaeobacter piscinae]|uniref:Uncharacterized protein n=1 Tax=Phaeobacter piscinae TaxID=1580596 RepID=A0ABM6PFU7_9RHOB|nr:hypothetical protein PhaeoP36_02555 [Phaeobacter piscinae]ATG40602.1 hypothetical protein PhaeoP14_02532 [Phaeobacter piscinae]AUQ87188.1 hypothetical protein PhaeoP42_02556 [Phaeobacter piscinae]AUR25071.1 hypothetical protein PhaeoP23_02555 [Phaeobacter piscinae]UTS81577.1 hypothetical protein OL67_002663 [Phaeobacter piscinae]
MWHKSIIDQTPNEPPRAAADIQHFGVWSDERTDCALNGRLSLSSCVPEPSGMAAIVVWRESVVEMSNGGARRPMAFGNLMSDFWGLHKVRPVQE